MEQVKKASGIYKKQNILLHKAFAAQGMPYQENKEVWMQLAKEIVQSSKLKAEREIEGLSNLTLGERHQMLMALARKGVRIFAPGVPASMKNWKKGDTEIETEIRMEDDRQVRMVLGMWAEMGYPVKTLRGLCFKLFRKDDPRWLSDAQLRRLVTVVQYRAQKKGLGVYYKRG